MAPSAAETGPDLLGTTRDPYADLVAYGNALIQTAIEQAVGQMPGDVPIEQEVFATGSADRRAVERGRRRDAAQQHADGRAARGGRYTA